MALATEPNLALQVGTRYATGILRAWAAAGARSVGARSTARSRRGKDKRFADPTWKDNAAFWLLRQEYLLWEQALQELVEGAPIDEDHAGQGRLPDPGHGRRGRADQLLR